MKLFPKLALAVSVLLIGTSVALSLSFYVTERRSIRVQAEQERRALLQNLVHITQESILTNDDLLLVKYTRWLQKWNPSLTSASVVNPHGEILAHSEPSQIGKSINPAAPAEPTTALWVLTQPVHLGTTWVATASIGFSQNLFEEQVQAQLRSLKQRLGSVAGGAVAAGLLLSFVLAHSWTRPVGTLAEAAKRVGQGEYTLDLSETNDRRDELGVLSNAFQSMAQELQELDQMKEDFVSAVTHELRSPLGAIESYLNLIQEEIRDGISPAVWQTYAERLRINTQRLSRFVNDLLDVAALERGKVSLQAEAVDLGHLIQEVVTFYLPHMAERHLVCATSITEGPVAKGFGDPEKIRQILVNLLSNAIKFTPDRGRIDIGLKVFSNKYWGIYVKDSGPGIAPENRDKIFNKFEQVRSSRQSAKGPKGTGLGLSITRALVELHGGRLDLDSTLGTGSCFTFTLPKWEENHELANSVYRR